MFPTSNNFRCMHGRRRFALFFACLFLLALPLHAQQARELDQLEERTCDIAAHCVGATVGIIVRDRDGQNGGGMRGMGSGVLVSEDGLILTAAHVIMEPGAELLILMPDGSRLEGIALGLDHDVDAGMARVSFDGPTAFLPLAQADHAKVGDWCLAVGHAGGILIDRAPPVRLGRILHIHEADDLEFFGGITTDATVISGDSGGPLVNLQGEVIGIHSNIGMHVTENRHVPIDAYLDRWDDLLAGLDLSEEAPAYDDEESNEEASPNEETDVEPAGDTEDGSAHEPASEVDDQRAMIRSVLRMRFGEVLSRDEIEVLVEASQLGPNGDMHLELTEQNTAVLQAIFDKLQAADQLSDSSDSGSGILSEAERQLGKVGDQVMAWCDPIAQQSAGNVVRIICDDEYAALGTVISAHGDILTKASELSGTITVIHGGDQWQAILIGVDRATDLALIRVDTDTLSPVRWAGDEASLGRVLVTPDAVGAPLAIGVLGVEARAISPVLRSLGNGNRAFLGVSGLGGGGFAKIEKIIEGGAAEAAGMLANDEIIRVDEMRIENHRDLVDAIGRYAPGEVVAFEVLREGESITFNVELHDATGAFDIPVNDELPTAQLSQRGGEISARRTGFPICFQHDGVVWANDCGGPVFDLEGEAVGINIARFGRTATYAIPADEVQRVIAQILNDNDR